MSANKDLGVFGFLAASYEIFKVFPLLKDKILAGLRCPIGGCDNFLSIFVDSITNGYA
jgi:hypothetical protein